MSTSNTDETDESLTRVDVDDLTEFEMKAVIPSCDFVVVGYDSSYSDADVSTLRVDDPRHVGSSFRTGVRGPIVGDDADRQIGFGKGPVRTSKSSGRIGSTLWVEYPAEEPPKERYTVTFRALTGNWSSASDDVDAAIDHYVDRQSFDNVEAPPEGERRLEDIVVDEDGRTQRRVVVDVPVTLTIPNPDTIDREEVIERARQTFDTRASYDNVMFREDVPDVGDHMVETGPYQPDTNIRKSVRYIVDDVTVESETI